MNINRMKCEFREISDEAMRLTFLEDHLLPGDAIFVQPLMGLVTSSK
jgi:hypothetical protein